MLSGLYINAAVERRFSVVLKNSPLLKSFSSTELIKVLNPSSIHAYFLSLDPTIIGNHVWPNSWLVTPYRSNFEAFAEQNTMPGYSMPPTIPATLTAQGYGYSNHCFEYPSIAPFVNSVDRFQPSALALSMGYTDMAKDFFPLGKFILAASQTNAFDEAHATSLALLILNFQVMRSFAGRDDASVTSSSERMAIVLSLSFAAAILLICSAVKTS